MKVKCINSGGWIHQGRKFLWFDLPDKRCSGPKMNDILTVSGYYWSKGEKFYIIEEWSEDDSDGWISDMFVPVEENYEAVTYSAIKEKAQS
jgi:hypothetical protein